MIADREQQPLFPDSRVVHAGRRPPPMLRTRDGIATSASAVYPMHDTARALAEVIALGAWADTFAWELRVGPDAWRRRATSALLGAVTLLDDAETNRARHSPVEQP